MEAKYIKWCPQHGYPLPCNKCGLGQYEAGKQAGIKEVVDWLKEHNSFAHIAIVFVPTSEWQAKLKEWGL